MAKERVPKVGDRVLAKGHLGVFVVTKIIAERQISQLAKIGSPDLKLMVTWQEVNFLDGQDSAETVTPIVREASKS